MGPWFLRCDCRLSLIEKCGFKCSWHCFIMMIGYFGFGKLLSFVHLSGHTSVLSQHGNMIVDRLVMHAWISQVCALKFSYVSLGSAGWSLGLWLQAEYLKELEGRAESVFSASQSWEALSVIWCTVLCHAAGAHSLCLSLWLIIATHSCMICTCFKTTLLAWHCFGVVGSMCAVRYVF